MVYFKKGIKIDFRQNLGQNRLISGFEALFGDIEWVIILN